MANLKHTQEGLMEAFEHQLAYEVNMFRHTYNFLHVPAWSPELANAIIKSFCVHARNLIEFFDQESATPGQARSDYIGAKHFCNGYIPWTNGGPSNDLRGRLNRQISHLTYDRTSKEEEKIGAKERAELVELIERELEIFSGCLRKPYVEKWPFAKHGGPRTTLTIGDSPYSSTNQVTMINSPGLRGDAYGATGSAGPTQGQRPQSKDN